MYEICDIFQMLDDKAVDLFKQFIFANKLYTVHEKQMWEHFCNFCKDLNLKTSLIKTTWFQYFFNG